MATSLAIVVLLGLLANTLFTKLKLPGFLGMLFLGMLIGPYALDLLDPDLMMVSADFRSIALIVILLRAGLGISREKLNSVGVTAIKMSCIPGLMEGFTVAFLSTKLLGFTFIQGGILGFIVAAVSPAVVVPLMLNFTENKVGTNKNIPTLILAGASIDDVFAITMFSTFLGIYSGSQLNIGVQIMHIPISILLGSLVGFAIGLLLVWLFNKYHIRDTKKVLIILGVAILITALEEVLKSRIEIAGLLGVMAIGLVILEKSPVVAKRLSIKLNKVWVLAELLLFVLVGTQVDASVALEAGFYGLILIALGLVARSIGVFISTIGTDLTMHERAFCAIAYTPKATVQAAIGAIPLSMGVESGDVILAIAVLAIIVTAPLGAIAIKATAPRWLTVGEDGAQ